MNHPESMQGSTAWRREAWSAAKLAVRSFSRDPSEANAAKMKSAWRRIRDADSAAVLERSLPGTKEQGGAAKQA